MSRFKMFQDLAKTRIGTMVVLTTLLGFFLGANRSFEGKWLLLCYTLIGTFLSTSGAAALNCYLERDVDRLMKRTRKRPLPSGQLQAHEALSFGIICILAGTALLVWQVNLLTGFLALLSAFLYVLVYTPLKRLTWLNTAIGAIPGALPPVGGWAAATGSLTFEAWFLFIIMFLWQHPHFYAIAWMYKDDYARAGFKMLPVIDADGSRTMRQVLIFSLLLIPASVLPSLSGMSGSIYFLGALILSWCMLIGGVMFIQSRSNQSARRLLIASVIYLPALFCLIAFDALIALEF